MSASWVRIYSIRCWI